VGPFLFTWCVPPKEADVVRQNARAFWTPQAPRRGEDRHKPIRINPVGRANLFKWLRGVGAIAEVSCDHHVTML